MGGFTIEERSDVGVATKKRKCAHCGADIELADKHGAHVVCEACGKVNMQLGTD